MASVDDDLATALGGLHREVNALYGVVAHRFGLTTQQVELLCQLTEHKPSFGELAGLLGCDKTNVTGMVDRLERRGLLAREPDAADRRVTRVVLTEQGVVLREDIRACFVDELAVRLPPADRARLVDVIAAAATALAAGR